MTDTSEASQEDHIWPAASLLKRLEAADGDRTGWGGHFMGRTVTNNRDEHAGEQRRHTQDR